ncbi:hypothetical protein D3C86_1223350 [compost metagenome]
MQDGSIGMFELSLLFDHHIPDFFIQFIRSAFVAFHGLISDLDHAFDIGNTHAVKFIEVVRIDPQETQTLHQRNFVIQCFL